MVSIVFLSGCSIPLLPNPPPTVPYYITNDPADIGKQKIDCCPEIGWKPDSIDWKDEEVE